MNDKQQLAAMGEHMADHQQPLCMAKQIEQLQARLHKTTGLLKELRDGVEGEWCFPGDLDERIDALLAGQVPSTIFEREGWPMPDSTEVTRTAPKRIWLQVSDDSQYHNDPFPGTFDGMGSVSWCWESMGGTQVEYVRADMLAFHELASVYANHSFTPQAPEPAVPEGWQLVPVEPTDDMLMVGGERLFDCVGPWEGDDDMTVKEQDWAARIYRAMLTAAPKPSSTK